MTQYLTTYIARDLRIRLEEAKTQEELDAVKHEIREEYTLNKYESKWLDDVKLKDDVSITKTT